MAIEGMDITASDTKKRDTGEKQNVDGRQFYWRAAP